MALRLVLNFYSDAPQAVGTATVVCGQLLVTGKHVLREFSNTKPWRAGKFREPDKETDFAAFADSLFDHPIAFSRSRIRS